MLYLASAFSISMVHGFDEVNIHIRKISLETAKEVLKLNEFTSIVGHEGTAQLFSMLLDTPVQANRVFVTLNENDVVLVGNLCCRLPEGKVLNYDELKEYSKNIEWFLVVVQPETASV